MDCLSWSIAVPDAVVATNPDDLSDVDGDDAIETANDLPSVGDKSSSSVGIRVPLPSPLHASSSSGGGGGGGNDDIPTELILSKVKGGMSGASGKSSRASE